MKGLAFSKFENQKHFQYIDIEKALTAFNGTKIAKSESSFIQREESKLRTST